MYEIGSREYEIYKIREEKSDKSCKERVTSLRKDLFQDFDGHRKQLLHKSPALPLDRIA